MQLRGVVIEDFCNYKLPSLFLITSFCDWKCCTENGLDISVCQNSELIQQPIRIFTTKDLYDAYANNNISKAVVIGGLEPFLQFSEILNLIKYFRWQSELCDFVIYTGYNQDEIKDELEELRKYKNIIVKFGRYIPNSNSIYDEILGVTLASDNQYAIRIS